METPIRMDDLGVPLFKETSISIAAAVCCRSEDLAGGWQTNTQTDCKIWRLDGGSFIDLQWLLKLGMFHGIWCEYDGIARSCQQINTNRHNSIEINSPSFVFLSCCGLTSFSTSNAWLCLTRWKFGETPCLELGANAEKEVPDRQGQNGNIPLLERSKPGAPGCRLCRQW